MHGRTKDNCQFVCEYAPDEMSLTTQVDQPILRINGIQMMPHSNINLVADLPSTVDLGTTEFRLIPQDVDMVAVANIVAVFLVGIIAPEE